MRRVAASAAAVLIVVLAPVISGVLGAAPAQAGGYLPSDETRVQNLLNATRTVKGLAKLARNDKLVGMARRQADRMAAKGSIYHNPSLGAEMTSSGLSWQKAGENVGMGPNVDLIEQAFLDSPHHYENIVDAKYDTVGIGVVDGADGRRYVVQVFADLSATPAPTAPKPAAPAPTTTAEPQAQTAAQVAPVSETPTPTTEPSATPDIEKAAPKPPSALPNVVIGGVVEPLDLGL
jgi:uncharacterized protein YkwD